MYEIDEEERKGKRRRKMLQYDLWILNYI
jgi:hypothetical protein